VALELPVNISHTSQMSISVAHYHTLPQNELAALNTAEIDASSAGDQNAGKKVVMPLNFFGATSTISACFRDGQYSLVSFSFAVLLLTVPRVPSHL